MRLLLATVVVAAAQRGATPTGHALLLGTQRTGTTWAMAELAKSPCVATTSELFIQFKWERGARMACLRMLYGDADARDRSLRAKCSAKFRGFLDKSQTRAAALKPQSLKPSQPRYDDRVRERSADEEKKRVEAIERQTAKVLAREEKKDQEYVSSFLAQLRAKAIESMHALLEAEADDDDA